VFENRVLRKMFELREELKRNWRKLHNEELHDLHSSPNIMRAIKSTRTRWLEHVAKPEVKVIFRRPRRRWEGNNNIYLNKIDWERVGWTDLAQARDKCRALTKAVINLRVP
jgi:uncharacterized protein (UPF0218 family)